MNIQSSLGQQFAHTFAAAWNRLERRLDNQLAMVRGISLAEYRLLKALAESPRSMASRVDLAAAVGLTPSAITRALRPLEKMGVVSTVKAKRDARLAIATLTPAGKELLQDASAVVNDTMDLILSNAPNVTAKIAVLSDALQELAQA